jgi:hypothetical protein
MSKVVRLLERLATQQSIPQDYMYYGVPSPWLQIKCMRVLQQFPLADDPTIAGALAEVLRRVVSVRSVPLVKQLPRSLSIFLCPSRLAARP